MPPTPRMIPFAGDLVTPRTTYQEMFAKKGGPSTMMRPTSGTRRNNPHPREGFLEPKSTKMDRDARMQERVRVAVKEYLDKLAVKENKPKVSKIPHAFSKDRQPIYKVRDKKKLLSSLKPSAPLLKRAREEDRRQAKHQRDELLIEATKILAPNKEKSPEPKVEAVRLPKQNNPRTNVAFRMVKKPPTPKGQQEHWIVWRTQTPSTPGKVKPVYRPLVANKRRAHTPTPPRPQPPSSSAEEDEERRPSTAPGFRMPTPPPAKPVSPPATPAAQSLQPRPTTPEPIEENGATAPEVTFAENYGNDDTDDMRMPSPAAASLRDAACSPTRPISAMSISSLAAQEMLMDPKLRPWVTGANDYEKQVAYNLFKSLNGGKAGSMARSMSAMGYTGRGRSPVPPRDRAVKSARARAPAATQHSYDHDSRPDRGGHDDEVVREWMSEIEKRLNERAKTPQPELIPRPVYSLPIQHHQVRPGSRQRYRKPPRKEYIHESSFFTNSNPAFRSHFIIAPDWVSEGLTIRKLEAQAAHNRKKHPPPGCYATATA